MFYCITKVVFPGSGTTQKLIGSFLLVLLSCGAFSQEESKIFISDEPFDPKSTGNIFVAVDNFNFFRNNEYKSEYASGYTLTGAWIRPKLIYYPDEKFRFEIGGQVLKYNGRDEYITYPWFAAVYKPIDYITFRMGNLNQDQNHGLPEPVLDSEHFLNGKPEAGIQANFKGDRLKTDMWIDWQQMIFKGDPFKERFVFGTVAEITLVRKGKLELTLPLTFNGLHEGGEIDTAPGLAHTNIAVTEGLKFSSHPDGSLFKSLYFETSLLQSTYPAGQTALTSTGGSAFYLHGGITSRYGNLMAGYWQGKRFFTPLGMPLFQNSAIDSPHATDLNKLYTISYLYDRILFKKSNFGFIFNMFYNPSTGKTSNYEALYLMINFSVLFKKSAS
jgi:hypothetical protein